MDLVERGHQVGMGGLEESGGREEVIDGTTERGPEGRDDKEG